MRLLIFRSIVLACLLPAPLRAEPIIEVFEDLHLARTAWPVGTGVPFPPGAMRDVSGLYLEDPAGSGKLPVQARILSRWSDGSVRWALLDTTVDLAAGQRRRLRVRSGETAAVAPAVTVTDLEEAITVDTGRLRFKVPRKRRALLEDLHLDGQRFPAGAVTSFMRFGETVEAAPPPTRVEAVERGPLRARVEVHGEYGRGFRYVMRIDAFAGQAFVRILHTFENHGGEAQVWVRQIGIEVPFEAAKPPSYQLGRVGRAPIGRRVRKAGARLAQLDNDTLLLEGEARRERASGWVWLHDDTHGVAVAGRYFWQEYPQGFELRRTGLRYDLWSPAARPALVGMGAAKTHELMVAFQGPRSSLPGNLDALVTPVVARVDPQWIRDSGAMPQAITTAGEGADFLRALSAAHERYVRRNAQERWDDNGQVRCLPGARQTPRTGAFGMWHWGDWNFPGYHDNIKGCDAWGNLEYDLTQVMALAFASTGERHFYDSMVVAARHFMDVDRIHFHATRPQWVGMNHPKNPLHFSFELGGVDLGHTWNEGLLSYYYLTGDERGREAALGIAGYLERRARGEDVRGNPRQWGWPQIALVAAYEATLERRYLDAAAVYARGGMRAHPPSLAHWKNGVLAEALTYTHAAPVDAELKSEIWNWLEQYAAATSEADPHDPRFFPALAYVARQKGDQSMIAAARAAAANLKFGNWGKPLTLGGRIGFRILSLTESARPERSDAAGGT